MANRRVVSDLAVTIGKMRGGRKSGVGRAVRRALVGAALCAVLISGACGRSGAQPQPVAPNATVLRAVDGDTIDVRSDERARLRVRIIGLDSPETHRPNVSVGCGGPEASDFARRTLEGRRVALVMDPNGDSTDRYGRTLAAVFLPDGTNFSVLSVSQGYAHAYVFAHRPSPWSTEIQAAEDDARAHSRGLWGPPCKGDTHSDPIAYDRPQLSQGRPQTIATTWAG